MSAWSRIVPAANREASVMIENRQVTLGMDKMGPEEKAVLRVSNACCWREVQVHSWSFLERRLSGATTWEKLGMNLR